MSMSSFRCVAHFSVLHMHQQKSEHKNVHFKTLCKDNQDEGGFEFKPPNKNVKLLTGFVFLTS